MSRNNFISDNQSQSGEAGGDPVSESAMIEGDERAMEAGPVPHISQDIRGDGKHQQKNSKRVAFL